jgi:hypothetical protein
VSVSGLKAVARMSEAKSGILQRIKTAPASRFAHAGYQLRGVHTKFVRACSIASGTQGVLE